MVTRNFKVVIDNVAKQQLKKAYNYIRKDSLQNAEKIKARILASIKELIKNPEKNAPDKYCIDNDKSYRAYEIYNYRITYHISDSEIRIVRVRHTKMNPLNYQKR